MLILLMIIILLMVILITKVTKFSLDNHIYSLDEICATFEAVTIQYRQKNFYN